MNPDPESESVCRRAKMTHKNRKKGRNFMFLSAAGLLRAEGFSYRLDVLYWRLKIAILITQNFDFFQLKFLKMFLSSNPSIRIDIRPKYQTRNLWIRIRNTAWKAIQNLNRRKWMLRPLPSSTMTCMAQRKLKISRFFVVIWMPALQKEARQERWKVETTVAVFEL